MGSICWTDLAIVPQPRNERIAEPDAGPVRNRRLLRPQIPGNALTNYKLQPEFHGKYLCVRILLSLP